MDAEKYFFRERVDCSHMMSQIEWTILGLISKDLHSYVGKMQPAI